MSHHCVVWIDHSEARIFELTGDELRSRTVKSHSHGPSRRSAETKHATADNDFYKSVTDDLADAKEILIVGPGTAKLELLRYAHAHVAAVEKRVMGMETVDHPTDAQLVAHAKHYFKAADHMK